MTKNLILWLVIAVILMTLFESFTSSDSSGRVQDYTSFVREVNSDQIQEVVFDDNVINGVKKTGERFVTVMPLRDPAIIDSLLTHNVRASGTKPEEPSNLHLLVANDSVNCSVDLLYAPNARWLKGKSIIFW